MLQRKMSLVDVLHATVVAFIWLKKGIWKLWYLGHLIQTSCIKHHLKGILICWVIILILDFRISTKLYSHYQHLISGDIPTSAIKSKTLENGQVLEVDKIPVEIVKNVELYYFCDVSNLNFIDLNMKIKIF